MVGGIIIMKITQERIKEIIREELNEVIDPYDDAYNNLHDALVNVHKVFKKEKLYEEYLLCLKEYLLMPFTLRKLGWFFVVVKKWKNYLELVRVSQDIELVSWD